MFRRVRSSALLTFLPIVAGSVVGTMARLALFSLQDPPPCCVLLDAVATAVAAAVIGAGLRQEPRTRVANFLIGFAGAMSSIGLLTTAALRLEPLSFVLHLLVIPPAVGVGAVLGDRWQARSGSFKRDRRQ